MSGSRLGAAAPAPHAKMRSSALIASTASRAESQCSPWRLWKSICMRTNSLSSRLKSTADESCAWFFSARLSDCIARMNEPRRTTSLRCFSVAWSPLRWTAMSAAMYLRRNFCSWAKVRRSVRRISAWRRPRRTRMDCTDACSA
eukprot:Amastigsp_a688639_8.p4 type:complete len:144 gc:universal Amastigsp_a688639_8:21-452(+)